MRRANRILGRVAAALLSVAALLVVSWIVYSAITGATLVIFRTGSMSPTMPQGALAVAEPISASEIAVGDVVTIDRSDDGRQPITHRVIEIRETSRPGTVEILLQGDANAVPDHEPYVVADVQRVVWSMPRLGTVLMVLQSPLGMTALTLLAGALTVWAFWPAPAARDAADDSGASGGSASEAVAGSEPDLSPASRTAAGEAETLQ